MRKKFIFKSCLATILFLSTVSAYSLDVYVTNNDPVIFNKNVFFKFSNLPNAIGPVKFGETIKLPSSLTKLLEGNYGRISINNGINNSIKSHTYFCPGLTAFVGDSVHVYLDHSDVYPYAKCIINMNGI